MSSTPEAAVEKNTVPQPRRHCQAFRHRQLSHAIWATSVKLIALARLGRPGQWILHQEDLYDPHLDTRPQTRNPNEEVPIYRLDRHGAPTKKLELIWAGKGPAPDFQDVAFWKEKQKHLDDKIEQINARLVRPRFTPEELQTLEALEQQPGHFFKGERYKKRKKMGDDKKDVFIVLVRLALLGRPGHWILHNEELYHPDIDTRPHTRATDKSILLRDEHFKGDTRVVGDGILMDFELTWAGQGPPPDFDDFFFWEDKLADLCDKERQAKEGRVQPQFTPDELKTLEALEMDQEHAFAKLRKLRMETPPVVPKTEEEIAARMKICQALDLIMNTMINLWDLGLAGQWVLHWERLYLPEYDTHCRERYNDEDDDMYQDNILVEKGYRLRFDTRFGPAPNFDDIAYWERKLAELRKKYAEVDEGRAEAHRFTEGELMRIALLESALSQKLEEGYDTDPKTARTEAWIDANATKVVVGDEHSRPRRPEAAKRKRPTDSDSDSDDETLHGNAMHPAKRSKNQPPAEPSAAVAMQRHVRSDAADAGASTNDHPMAAALGTRRSVDGLSGVANRETQPPTRARHSGDRHRTRRGAGSPAAAASGNLRRSARIAALPPRKNMYR